MRALVMTQPSAGPAYTQVGDVAMPQPGPGQVSVDVGYAGVNFIDVMARRGDAGYATGWPYVPGLEVAGTIRAAGPGVAGLRPGQLVAAFTRGGGLAEVAVADAALTVPVPDGVTLPVAAAAPLMLSTAWLLLTEVARIRPGETVLMHSASGGVGGAVAQLAPLLDAIPLIGTVGRPEKAAEARLSGWRHATYRDAGLTDAVRAVAGGGVDVILDPSGTRWLGTDLEVAAPGARIVLFGNPEGAQPGPLPSLAQLIGGNIALAGFSMSRLTATAPRLAADALRTVLRLLAAHRLTVPLTDVVPLKGVAAVQQMLAEGSGTGKYVAAAR